MKQFTSDQIQSQFEKLPKDLQDAISSPEVHDSIIKIGNKYGLHVDQLGEMVDLVGLVMLGLSPSNSFVTDFTREAGVKSDIASSVADDINAQVFGKIRASMQAIEAKNQAAEAEKSKQNISDLERVGGFSIEPAPTSQDGNGSVPTNLPGAEEVIESKEDLMAGIENPPPIRPSAAKPEINHTDIIVDNLLAGPVAAVEKKIKVETPPSPPVKQVPKKPAGPDSYREPVE